MKGYPDLLLADGSLRPWHGHVTRFALLGSDGGLARYKLVIQPWLAFLAHNQDSWVFQDKTMMESSMKSSMATPAKARSNRNGAGS